ncbi:hypothetical protein EYC84_006768 [Monilinia fructicola]|uniref:Uncharacterized protein n=1 Tax=Monilinia fructicola TaxID=38448 RepID=A0A5M9K502_MONFR|nr:hypothetical protein EYC84_006768 [Monilinia fructicola]
MIFWLQVSGAVVFGVYAIWKIHSKFWVSRQNEALRFNNEKIPDNIVPLPNFDWHTTEPLKIRPFKPVYHMTMGLQSCSPSELIEMDRTYVDRLAIQVFDRLEVGKVVKRFNWSITTHARLFAASGNHLYGGEEAEAEEFDINDTYLRCERQLVHRLSRNQSPGVLRPNISNATHSSKGRRFGRRTGRGN